MPDVQVLPYVFDLELSGRCNTVCSFCPRHEMKRGESYMSEENFEHFIGKFKAYANCLENRVVSLYQEGVTARLGRHEQSPLRVIMCGMGESLMHRRCPEWIQRIRTEVGVRVTVVTNGLLLKEKIINSLFDSGITVVLVSVPGIDRESYSRYMKLDWDRVLNNIKQAHAAMPGRVQINATIPDDASYTASDIANFWGELGIPIAGISQCHNRGGFLENSFITGKHGHSSSKFCGIIARHNFIAWDGSILSCCHDLHAENVLGHVATDDFFEVAAAKTPLLKNGASYRICKNCNDCERLQPEQILTAPLVAIGRRESSEIRID